MGRDEPGRRQETEASPVSHIAGSDPNLCFASLLLPGHLQGAGSESSDRY